MVPQDALQDLLSAAHPEAARAARTELPAVRERLHCFLYYKGFVALQAHRVAHGLWSEGRSAAALLLQIGASHTYRINIRGGCFWFF